MEWLEDGGARPGGGSSSQSGAFYHLSFRSGSRAGGACARSAFDYIAREGAYAGEDRDPVTYMESDHMPAWAAEDPSVYWQAADLYERANGRLYVSADFALPRDLSPEDQIVLAREFAQDLTREESLPYTLAIHAGRGADGREHNPHVHLLISERRNDGIERDPRQWFARAAPDRPSRGGAMKTRALHGRAWVEQARGRLADRTNDLLARLGRSDRVDHRSYARQGIDRAASTHYGPTAAPRVHRGEPHQRLDWAVAGARDQDRIEAIGGAIAVLEAERRLSLHSEPERDRRGSPSSYTDDEGRGTERDQEWSPSR